jgi:hypothetical protein
MTTTELPRTEIYTAPTPGAFGSGAAIFRRLERGQRRPKWMTIAVAVVLSVSAIGIGIALKAMSASGAPPRAVPAQVQMVAPAPVAAPVATPVPAATPAPVAAPAQLRVVHAPVKVTHYPVAPAKRARVSRAASAGASGGAKIAVGRAAWRTRVQARV